MTEDKKCNDLHCAAHHHIMVHGRHFIGTVLATRAQKTATIEWIRKRYIPKFERYEVLRSRLHVHNPDCIDAQLGDVVEVGETRKLSKTKSFVILKKIGQKLEALEKQEHRYDAIKKPKQEVEE